MLNEVETECCQNSDGDYNIFHSLQWRIQSTILVIGSCHSKNILSLSKVGIFKKNLKLCQIIDVGVVNAEW